MMMNYLYVSKKKHVQQPRRYKALMVSVVLSASAVLVWNIPFFSFFTTLWSNESESLKQLSLVSGTMTNTSDLMSEIQVLEEKQADLIAQVEELQAKAAAYDEIIGYGTSTTEVVTNDNHVLAKIIRRPPFTAFDTYTIDQGSDQGVAIGNKVYARSFPVGEVIYVTPSNATVSLYSSPGTKTLISFGTSTEQYEAYGIGNGTLKVDVPRDAEITLDIPALAPDRSIDIVGNVRAIEREEDTTIQSVFISLPFAMNKTHWFTVNTHTQ